MYVSFLLLVHRQNLQPEIMYVSFLFFNMLIDKI